MDETAELKFSNFSDLTSAELAKLWWLHLGGAPPQRLPKSLLAKLLAYRLQARELGDLPKSAVKYLDLIADDLNGGRDPACPYPADNHLKPGTVIMREHNQVMHNVIVKKEGYAWNGETFSSLSAVAKAMTGTNWNGHRFFGLKQKQAKIVEVAS